MAINGIFITLNKFSVFFGGSDSTCQCLYTKYKCLYTKLVKGIADCRQEDIKE